MRGLDRYRLGVAVVLTLLGLITVVRFGILSHVWPVALAGVVLTALGLYRINQYRNFRITAGRR